MLTITPKDLKKMRKLLDRLENLWAVAVSSTAMPRHLKIDRKRNESLVESVTLEICTTEAELEKIFKKCCGIP